MSSFEQRPDSGRLMAAQSKKTEKSPDYWGEIAINIKDLSNVTVENGLHVFKLSGWKKKSKAGATYLSVSINRMEAQSSTPKHKDEDDEF
jgi:uncharacterized protein (DUF736 family)